jgi:hypothetical protein
MTYKTLCSAGLPAGCRAGVLARTLGRNAEE